jgi:hypothetical protein
MKTFGLAALAAVAAMAFVGATSASATFDTTICKKDAGLLCEKADQVEKIHLVLKTGTVSELLALVNILCLGLLVEATALGLSKLLPIHILKVELTGCGTGSTHSNCTMTTQELPLADLLKTGPDQGKLILLSGRSRLQCPNLGIDCVYDNEGVEFDVGANHMTANEASTNELGGKFFCPDEGLLDALLEGLEKLYIKS